MSKWQIDYNQSAVLPTGASVETPLQAAHAIVNGYIPQNLVNNSFMSNNFRDATLAKLLLLASSTNRFEEVLTTLSQAMQTSPDDTQRLQVFSEYTAAVAFAWEHADLAGKTIMRNKPQNTSPFLWSIVSAIKKNIPSSMYATLVMSSGDEAERNWQIEKGILSSVSNTATSLVP